LILFAHRNFPDYAADVLIAFLRAYDASSNIELFNDAYPDDTPDDEWIGCLGKSHPKRIILSFSDGIRFNAIFKKQLRDSGCSFVLLDRSWSKKPWMEIAWTLLRFWPRIAVAANAAIAKPQQCILEVTYTGKIHRVNL
jgi:hypothetical protein